MRGSGVRAPRRPPNPLRNTRRLGFTPLGSTPIAGDPVPNFLPVQHIFVAAAETASTQGKVRNDDMGWRFVHTNNWGRGQRVIGVLAKAAKGRALTFHREPEITSVPSFRAKAQRISSVNYRAVSDLFIDGIKWRNTRPSSL
jgi:hypothetical protein